MKKISNKLKVNEDIRVRSDKRRSEQFSNQLSIDTGDFVAKRIKMERLSSSEHQPNDISSISKSCESNSVVNLIYDEKIETLVKVSVGHHLSEDISTQDNNISSSDVVIQSEAEAEIENDDLSLADDGMQPVICNDGDGGIYKYFSVEPTDTANVRATCILCKKTVAVAKKANSNLIRHMKVCINQIQIDNSLIFSPFHLFLVVLRVVFVCVSVSQPQVLFYCDSVIVLSHVESLFFVIRSD